MSVATVEGQPMVAVEPVSTGVTLVPIKSLPTDAIPDQSVKLGFGLIGFKLYLQNGVTSAAVKIHFDRRVPKDAKLYKYMVDTGWQRYPNAVFSPDGKSVTLMLEDGGAGDEDGVENGVIVDPSGIAYTDPETADSASLSTGGIPSGASSPHSCFISTVNVHSGTFGFMSPKAAMLMGMMLLAAGLLFAGVFQVGRK